MSPLHPDYTALDASLDRLKSAISAVAPQNLRAQFFAGQIFENYRVARTFRSLVQHCIEDDQSSPESFEVVARLCFERTILISYCHSLNGDEPLRRFEKTNDWSAKRVWPDDYAPKHSESPASQLPDYRGMCELVDSTGDMLRIFQQLSHIAHPRSSVPAYVSERTFISTGNGTAQPLRLERARTVVDVVARSVSLSGYIAIAELHGRDK